MHFTRRNWRATGRTKRAETARRHYSLPDRKRRAQLRALSEHRVMFGQCALSPETPETLEFRALASFCSPSTTGISRLLHRVPVCLARVADETQGSRISIFPGSAETAFSRACDGIA